MYDQIARNKRNSWILVIVVTLVLVGLGFLAGEYWGNGYAGAGFAVVIAVVSSLATYYGGAGMILAMSRAKRIEKKDHPRLFNVVEELAIAGGLPMPAIYIIDDSAPNAFATGRDPEHASVAITTGLLQKLSRDELQGVMAHELSHVGNRDILFAMMVGIMVGSIALVSDFFLRSVFWSRGGRKRDQKGSAGAIMLVVALLLAVLAPIFAKLLQLAVSRQREYLADASAVKLTRYPEGLASALEKISGDREVLEAANRATQHLYIVNPIKPFEKRVKGLFSTHPPIEDRVRRIRAM
ncbi:MAG TPA: zinc metalloprotease HtpX [Candidatus Eisenbacteria bacterium]|uniref:Protease HtpX homolog n=1 Tax=Eiseniibacteriota bacterium TaxID=2212470 RepID=A0A7V2F478_UNCEI|nr:zinc metalloprotease HtpX [Candidatus Eisenbacteria bacterium]